MKLTVQSGGGQPLEFKTWNELTEYVERLGSAGVGFPKDAIVGGLFPVTVTTRDGAVHRAVGAAPAEDPKEFEEI